MIIKALVVAGGYTWHQKKGENNPRLKAAGIVRYYTHCCCYQKRLEKCNLCVCVTVTTSTSLSGKSTILKQKNIKEILILINFDKHKSSFLDRFISFSDCGSQDAGEDDSRKLNDGNAHAHSSKGSNVAFDHSFEFA